MEFTQTLKDWLPLVLSGGLLGVLPIWWQWRDRRTRSRLSGSVDLELPSVPESIVIYKGDVQNLLFGRKQDVERLKENVEANRLLFVTGPSGAGKSTLLKIGLCRELFQGARWLPVYLDIWGADWASGPRNVFTDCVRVALENGLPETERGNLVSSLTRDNVFATLARVPRRTLLVFDQVDDYVAAHRQRFLDTETGCLIHPERLVAENSFWREVRDLLGDPDGRMHVVFSIRGETQEGLAPFRFLETPTYPVYPIDDASGRAIIDSALPESAVSHPENGFHQLKQVLLHDLGRAILPVRIRVAIAGLAKIQDRLTPGAYRREGGLPGLEASYLDRQIQTTGGDPEAVQQLLMQFVFYDRGLVKTRRDVHRNELKASDDVLESLRSKRLLLRRVVPQEGERWSLYHDYLSFGLAELDKRKRRSEIELDEAFQRFRHSSGTVDRWSSLLLPGQQARVWASRIRGQLRFRDKRRFVLMSLPRLVANWPVVVLLMAGSIYWGVLGSAARAKDLVRAFDSSGSVPELTENALWIITAGSSSQRSAVWREFSKPENLLKLKVHAPRLLRALTGLSEAEIRTYSGRANTLLNSPAGKDAGLDKLEAWMHGASEFSLGNSGETEPVLQILAPSEETAYVERARAAVKAGDWYFFFYGPYPQKSVTDELVRKFAKDLRTASPDEKPVFIQSISKLNQVAKDSESALVTSKELLPLIRSVNPHEPYAVLALLVSQISKADGAREIFPLLEAKLREVGHSPELYATLATAAGNANAPDLTLKVTADLQSILLDRNNTYRIVDLSESFARLVSFQPDRAVRVKLIEPLLQNTRKDFDFCPDALPLASRPDDLSVAVEILQWPQCYQRTAEILTAIERALAAHKRPVSFRSLGSFIDWVSQKNREGRPLADLEKRPRNPHPVGFGDQLDQALGRLGF